HRLWRGESPQRAIKMNWPQEKEAWPAPPTGFRSLEASLEVVAIVLPPHPRRQPAQLRRAVSPLVVVGLLETPSGCRHPLYQLVTVGLPPTTSPGQLKLEPHGSVPQLAAWLLLEHEQAIAGAST